MGKRNSDETTVPTYDINSGVRYCTCHSTALCEVCRKFEDEQKQKLKPCTCKILSTEVDNDCVYHNQPMKDVDKHPTSGYIQVIDDVKQPGRLEYVTTAGWETTISGEVESHLTEVKFPKQCETFKELINKAYETHLKKNQDYSPANITIMGEAGIIVRIWDKFCRICNLKGIPFPCVGPDISELLSEIEDKIGECHEKKDKKTAKALLDVYEKLEKIEQNAEFDFSTMKEKEPSVEDEALEDTWLDLMVYSIIGNIFRKGHWGR